MSIFNLSWFKTRKQQEHLNDLLIEEQTLKNEILEKHLSGMTESPDKPYKKLKLVNDVLTVIFNDGSIVNKIPATANDFVNVKNCVTEKAIIEIMMGPDETPEKDILDKIQVTKEDIDNVINFPDFETRGGAVYIKGIDRSLPALLVSKFAEIIGRYGEGIGDQEVSEIMENDTEYISLKRFFLWCCLNPRAEVADKLYDFLVRNDFRITKQGFFVALRNVVSVRGKDDNELVDAITNAYNKVKAVWKKNPTGFELYKSEDGEYSIHKTAPSDAAYSGNWVGNLNDLYLGLSDMKENRYTDAYTGSFEIKIGQKVSMPPEQCSWSTADCAEAGLHFAGHTAPYVLCGNTTVFTLHNPMKVVGIGTEKGRCWEYLPFMTTTVAEAEEIMNSKDFDFLELDEQYAVEELQNLEEKVKEGFAVEAKKHEFSFPNISSSQIKNIVNILDEMNDAIKSRVITA